MWAVFAAIGLIGFFRLIESMLRGFSDDLWERIGLSGLLSLGAMGTLTLLAGVTASWVLIVAVIGVWVHLIATKLGTFWRPGEDFWPKKAQSWILISSLALLIFPLIACFVPTSSVEWDSLAYHLAVPKLWAEAGRIYHIVGIHHSNFPFGTEVLTMLMPPGVMEVGAKLVSLIYCLLGCITLYGLARRRYGTAVAAWVPLVLLGAPVVLWEAGTAYVDVSHGLFAGLAILYASEWVSVPSNDLARLTGALLGFALASKFTGLQVFGLVLGGMVLATTLKSFGASHAKSQSLKQIAATFVLALLLGGGWYVKSYVYTGNPVYPFFYRVLGGRDWDQWRSDIYSDEQQSFGVGRTSPGTGSVHAAGPSVLGRDVSTMGSAILGLAYQPGRYTNPRQTEGGGFPIGSIGAMGLALLLGLAFLGPKRNEETFALGIIALQFVAWFFLSQQSRYMAGVVVVAAGVAPGVLLHIQVKRVFQVGIVCQALFTAWILQGFQTTEQLKVIFGIESTDDYRGRVCPFAKKAEYINSLTGVKKVALYDEVFGFYLDKPYMWANPGHSKFIPYETMKDGQDYADRMKSLGFSHIYINLGLQDAEHRQQWLSIASGQVSETESLAVGQKTRSDLNAYWQWLTADAVRRKAIVPTSEDGKGPLVFRIP